MANRTERKSRIGWSLVVEVWNCSVC